MLTLIATLVVLNIVLYAGRSLAGAGAIPASAERSGPEPRVAPTKCTDTRRAIIFYHHHYHGHLAAMKALERRGRHDRGRKCGWAKFLAERWQRRAAAARKAAASWHDYHWDWRSWLPDKWARIGACETGYGQRPGRWDWNSGTYQGAFGFYHGSWDAFVPHADPKAAPYPSEAYLATPRQQYEVALAIWRRYGFSGWGCRGA